MKPIQRASAHPGFRRRRYAEGSRQQPYHFHVNALMAAWRPALDRIGARSAPRLTPTRTSTPSCIVSGPGLRMLETGLKRVAQEEAKGRDPRGPRRSFESNVDRMLSPCRSHRLLHL